MQFQVTIDGDREVISSLKRVGSSLTDLRKPFGDIGGYLERYYSGISFASRGGVFGGRWPALSPAYEQRKLKKWGSRPMLIASGRMQRSFEHDAQPTFLRVFNTAPYFKYHQSSEEPRTRLPRRAMLGVNDTIEGEVVRIISSAIGKTIEAA